jgi:ATP-dependent Zn protease
VRALTQEALNRAVATLTRNRAALETGAALLIEHETLTREELPEVIPDQDASSTAPPKPVQLAS